MRQKDIRPAPARIEFKGMKFLITDRPSDSNIQNFIVVSIINNESTESNYRKLKSSFEFFFIDLQELKKNNVSTVVRVCEPSYKIDELESQGISVRDLAYDDGTPPPQNIVDEWLELLRHNYQENPEGCVAVHCVAGLGRAPVLVSVALIELGLKYEAAVEMIREKRRGAINARQLAYLEKYRPKSRLKNKNGHKNSCCVQ